jgi:L-lactate dehydrogenase complex protein LldG
MYAKGSREAVLTRIRSALKTTAAQPSPALHSPVFAQSELNPVESFRLHCKNNLVQCIVTADSAETASALLQVISSLPAGQIFAQDSSELRRMLADCGRPVQWSHSAGPDERSLATITHCEALVASTGTIVVSSETGGRGGSVVAPVHVVVASSSQLVPDLEAAFEHLVRTDSPQRNSFVGFITGCSRTADIEKILVIGAHGPRRVIVVLQAGA